MTDDAPPVLFDILLLSWIGTCTCTRTICIWLADCSSIGCMGTDPLRGLGSAERGMCPGCPWYVNCSGCPCTPCGRKSMFESTECRRACGISLASISITSSSSSLSFSCRRGGTILNVRLRISSRSLYARTFARTLFAPTFAAGTGLGATLGESWGADFGSACG